MGDLDVRVCMFVTTSVTSDPRVMKEARALTEAGHRVLVFGVRRTGSEPRSEVTYGIQVRRLELWHLRFVRWLKKCRGLTPTQGMFDTASKEQEQSSSKWRRWAISIVHQVEDILHLFTVFCAFFFAASKQAAEIYHAHDVDTLLPALLMAELRGKPLIYDAHEYWYGQSGRAFSHRFIRLVEGACISRCSHVLTVGRSIAEQMAEHYHIAPPTVLLNVPADTAPQAFFPLREDQKIQILYLGGYFAHRGLDILVAALPLVQTPVHLTLQGYGEMESALKAQVERLRLDAKVTFAPPVPVSQIVESASGYHIGVLPFERRSAFQLSLPNKLFEYMAAGLAILTNMLPEVADIVRRYELGQVYDSEDPAVLAEAIDQLAGKRELLEACRHRSWQTYRTYYAWDRHRQVLVDTYADLSHD